MDSKDIRKEFSEKTEVAVLPNIRRDKDGNVMPSRMIVTIDVVPSGRDFRINVEAESVLPAIKPCAF